jgi:hypothetical protein
MVRRCTDTDVAAISVSRERQRGRCLRFRLLYYVAVFLVAATMTALLWLAGG